MNSPSDALSVGIDDMVAYLPELYLPIEDLAKARGIEYAKLNKGLGLTAMSFPDAHEDAASMAANAVRQLIEQNNIHPGQIGRLYMGTESALDGSKPTATYVLEMLSRYFEPRFGKDCFRHCDVVDLTFACIGAVDALQNTLDWIKGGEDRLGIVVGSDIAKYELVSTGEYTQGAGAVALLLKKDPRLLAIAPHWGVATKSVHDFFKPRRQFSKREIIDEVLQMAGIKSLTAQDLLNRLNGKLEGTGVISMADADVYLHRDTPVFDGPYSNECYQERIKEALEHFACQAGIAGKTPVTDRWRRLVFHLPYAYQARRMFSEIFLAEGKRREDVGALLKEMGSTEPVAADFDRIEDYNKAHSQFLRAVTKTSVYRSFVAEKIEKGERASSLVGNLYTSSIFLSLMSVLEADSEANEELAGSKIGFFAYGSGAKSKIFEGTVQRGWQQLSSRFQLMKALSNRKPIDYSTYEQLHRGKMANPVKQASGVFYLHSVHREKDNREGARTYAWKEKKEEKIKA